MRMHKMAIAWALFFFSALSAADAVNELYMVHDPATVHSSGTALIAAFVAVMCLAGGMTLFISHYFDKFMSNENMSEVPPRRKK